MSKWRALGGMGFETAALNCIIIITIFSLIFSSYWVFSEPGTMLSMSQAFLLNSHSLVLTQWDRNY